MAAGGDTATPLAVRIVAVTGVWGITALALREVGASGLHMAFTAGSVLVLVAAFSVLEMWSTARQAPAVGRSADPSPDVPELNAFSAVHGNAAAAVPEFTAVLKRLPRKMNFLRGTAGERTHSCRYCRDSARPPV
jgi:hypothetical protein